MLNISAVVFFSIWFLISILAQFDFEIFEKYKKVDLLRLIPRWTFFAPNPGRTDHHIICRDKFSDGKISDWRDLTPIRRRQLWSGIWNPEKREVKVISDAVSTIIEMITKEAEKKRSLKSIERSLLIYPPYLLLLNLIMCRESPQKNTISRQFAIVDRAGFVPKDNPQIFLKSPFHSWK